MGLNKGAALRRRRKKPRRDEIAFIAGRLLDELVAARNPAASEGEQLRQICRASVVMTIDIVNARQSKEPFDVSDGLGELCQTLLNIIRDEYALVLNPEPLPGLLETLTMATGGLMYRGACGLIGPDLDVAVDHSMTTVMRWVA